MSYPAFLAAIRDEPHSDVPRLICADWLEDNGDPERAEFIRIQIELSAGVRERGRSLELLRRLRALIVRHRERWLGALADHAPGSVFERGFVEQVELRAAALLGHGEEIFASHPIHRLTLRSTAGDWKPEVAGCAALACVTALDLSENPLGDRGVAALSASPHLGRLRSLELRQAGFSGEGLRRLVSGGAFASLARLNLRDNALSTPGARALAQTPGLPALAGLNLTSTRINDRGAQALAGSARLGGLRTLRLSHNPLTEGGVRAILRAPGLAGLKVLEVYGTEMDSEARGRLRAEFHQRLVC